MAGPESKVEQLTLKFYTLTEAAKELGRSRQSLHELYKRGRLPFEKIGNKVMITGGTVEFLKRNPEKRIDKKITGV
jgi:excisionase family DNA binding protein